MNIEIVGKNVTMTEAIHQHAFDRLHASLDQHAEKIESIRVVLTDLNGPKGGRDMLCSILVKMRHGRVLRVQRKGEDCYANISHAADSVKRAAGRLVNRKNLRSHRSSHRSAGAA